jgi:AcrR family transcriptional regulator
MRKQGMAEKVLKKSAMKKQQMLDVAEALITQDGAHELTVRKIAQRMGCAVGLLYRLFDSLDDVVIGVNLRTLKALEQHIVHATKDVNDASAYLEVMALAYVDYVMHHTYRWQAVTGFHFDKDAPEDYAAQQKRLFDILEMNMTRLYPHISGQAVALEARALWAGMDGISSLAASGKLDKEGDLGVKPIVHVLLNRFLMGADKHIQITKGDHHA